MAGLLALPKEVEKEKLEEFLEQVKKDFPAAQFPEIFVHYQETDSRIIIVGIGKSNECAEKMLQVVKRNPELKQGRNKAKMLRAPRTKFLLR
jgi:uncharacterized protein YutE (UPF0331/DUF86 family)